MGNGFFFTNYIRTGSRHLMNEKVLRIQGKVALNDVIAKILNRRLR